MAFTAINHDGARFEAQLASEGHNTGHRLDIFAVIGLHADDDRITLRAVRQHIRKIVLPHVFERGTASGAKTTGPGVPQWKHVNIAKERMQHLNEVGFARLKTAWSARSRQTWDPFAPLGSADACLPPPGHRALPDHYYAHVEDVVDEDDLPRASGIGTEEDPCDLDPDEETASSPRRPPSRPSTPPPPSGVKVPVGSRPTPQKRRLDPRGMLLGTWRKSGLHADEANAVFVSRDRINRINRRISKETMSGRLCTSRCFDAKKTACSHEDIDHLPEWAGMTKDEVNSHVMPLLDAAAGATEPPPTPSRRSTASSTQHQARGARFFADLAGEMYDDII